MVLVLFPFSIFAIRSQHDVLSRRIGDGRSAAVQPTSAADARARLKSLRARPTHFRASIVVMSILVPVIWVVVFAAVGRRVFALRI